MVFGQNNIRHIRFLKMSGYILYFCEDTDISSVYGIQARTV